ncbi:MAG: NAD(P)H-dependent oxidoreductase subunit E [Alphaproteobacteria bacterium]|jgi:NADH:ubiquinone oxidoreductase subunit E|nr:NAD(P)H-dependent oxidoreductase subunit E [Alphaproteobacteria bacterium]
MNKFTEIISKYPKDRSYLIEILREIQKEYSYISSEAMQTISKELGIMDIDVEDVVDFYDMLSKKPQGKYVIRVCKTACCKIAGADSIIDSIKKEIGVNELGEISTDGLFSIVQTECIGQCDKAPAMLINEKPYGFLTSNKISEIIKEYKNA